MLIPPPTDWNNFILLKGCSPQSFYIFQITHRTYRREFYELLIHQFNDKRSHSLLKLNWCILILEILFFNPRPQRRVKNRVHMFILAIGIGAFILGGGIITFTNKVAEKTS